MFAHGAWPEERNRSFRETMIEWQHGVSSHFDKPFGPLANPHFTVSVCQPGPKRDDRRKRTLRFVARIDMMDARFGSKNHRFVKTALENRMVGGSPDPTVAAAPHANGD